MANLYVTPSTLEVDYDKNLTELYEAITDQKWDRAVTVCRKDPVQAATWVVRHYEDDDEIMWRFLPIHSACARQPPAYVVQALLKAYPDGAKCVDDQGMYALHYACGNQASRDVIRLLLVNFPEAATLADPRGMLPIHYLACWGPSSVAVVDMLLVAHSDVVNVRDEEGNTPLDLAREGDYPERDAVMAALKKWLNDSAKRSAAGSTQNSTMGNRSASKTSSRSLKLDIAPSESEEEKKDNDEHRYRGGKSSQQRTRTSSYASATARTVSPTQVSRLEEQVRQLQIQLKDKGAGDSRFTPTAESRDDVNRLHSEIEKLQHDLKSEEREVDAERETHGQSWRKQYDESDKKVRDDDLSWKARFLDLEKSSLERERSLLQQLRQLEDQLKEKEDRLEEARCNLDTKDGMFSERDAEIEELKKKLEQSRSERDGLRMTLGDLMEQHDLFKKKSHQLTDRLGSLSVSLESMMEQQKTVAVSLKERNDQYKDVLKKRQEKLRELEELEMSMQKDENNLEASLTKQMKEMEAIAAVIAAARD